MQGRDIAIVIGVVVLAILLVGLISGGMIGPMMGWGFYGPGPYAFGTWGIVMGIIMLVFWGLIIGGAIWLVVWLLRSGRPTARGPEPSRSALDILRERYARGEITREQYEQMRQDLQEDDRE